MLTFIIIHIMLNIVFGQSTVNILRILFVLKKQNSEFNLFLQKKKILFYLSRIILRSGTISVVFLGDRISNITGSSQFYSFTTIALAKLSYIATQKTTKQKSLPHV